MDLPELLALARRMNRNEFVHHFAHPFLARPRMSHTMMGDDPEISTDVDATEPRIDPDEVHPAAVRYLRLVRRDGSPLSDRLTVGRARSCDVNINDRSVSKLHLVFYPHQELDAWMLSDEKSSNGTWLNGERLAPKSRVPVKPGDIIKLGHIEVRFIDPGLLYDSLAKKLPRTQPPQ